MKRFNKQWLGEVPYGEALSYQKQVREHVKEQFNGVILGLEHPSVITTGLREPISPTMQSFLPIPVVKTDRGGQTTLHNPGQLIIYPILPLKKWDIGVREYVNLLLKTTENFILNCNIIIVPKNNGVYTHIGKIASVGINVKQGISTHGVAINISNNLTEFAHISPCGVSGQAMDKVENYQKIALLEAFQLWCTEFESLLPQEQPSVLTSMSLSQ